MSAAREAVARALFERERTALIDCGFDPRMCTEWPEILDGHRKQWLAKADAALAALRPFIATEIRAWAESETRRPHHNDRRTAVSENRFADCKTLEAVLWRFWLQTSGAMARGTDSVNALEAEAVARIRELTPPSTVSEEARERARRVLANGPFGDEGEYGHIDRIIDALGYTPAPDGFSDPGNWHPIEEHPYLNDPPSRVTVSPPVVELAPDELRWLAAVVEDYEKLYNDASRVVDDDTLPPMFYLHLRDSRQSVRVLCGENCWVLRIGGDQ